jgi:hypothetical protein
MFLSVVLDPPPALLLFPLLPPELPLPFPLSLLPAAALTLDFSSLLQFRMWRHRSWKPPQNYDFVSFFEVRYSTVLSIKSTEMNKKYLSRLQ